MSCRVVSCRGDGGVSSWKLLQLDSAVGNISRAFAAAAASTDGEARDVVTIFASDNGPIPFITPGGSSAGSAWPLRGRESC